jgi:hypothetical protein
VFDWKLWEGKDNDPQVALRLKGRDHAFFGWLFCRWRARQARLLSFARKLFFRAPFA